MTQQPSNEPFATLTRLEQSLWQAETRGDRHLMEQPLAGDFREFGRSGRVWSRSEMLFDGCLKIDIVLPLPQFKITLLNDVTALVTYDSIVTFDEIEYARRSSVWSLIDGHWRLRFHQGTPYHPGDRKEG